MAVTPLPTPGVTPGGPENDYQHARVLNDAITSRYQEVLALIAALPPDITPAEIEAMIDQRVDPLADLLAGLPLPQTRKYLGPVSDDPPVITGNAAPDGSYNKSYLISGGVQPASWPIDVGPGPQLVGGAAPYTDFNSSVPLFQPRYYRFYMDGTKMAWQYTNAVAATDAFLVYVDGAPVSFTPTAYGASGVKFATLVFPTAKPRLIEILSTIAIGDVFTANPYRLYAPPPRVGPRVFVVGDSYAKGVTMQTTQTFDVYGAYAQMAPWLGTENFMTDGIGGTGYLKDNPPNGNDYRDATRQARLVASNPDVVIVHGGGANDLYLGAFTVAQIVTQAIAYFTELRAALPNAKLVFVEGFSPPNGFSTFNDEYIDIRTQLQAALTDVGVYYIDVATSSAWLDGSGYIGNTTGVGNSDIYIGGDGIHLSIAGAQYILGRLVPKFRAVLADDGTLLNTLI